MKGTAQVCSQLDKLTSLSSGTCHRKWKFSPTKKMVAHKIWESLARRRRCLREFSAIFLRVLVCLKAMFSDGQDVKYDSDIAPHPHLFHGTKSHEHSAHRDNRVNTTWKWRGEITQLIVTGVSRLTYCLLQRIHQRRSNTAKSKFGLSLWRR